MADQWHFWFALSLWRTSTAGWARNRSQVDESVHLRTCTRPRITDEVDLTLWWRISQLVAEIHDFRWVIKSYYKWNIDINLWSNSRWKITHLIKFIVPVRTTLCRTAGLTMSIVYLRNIVLHLLDDMKWSISTGNSVSNTKCWTMKFYGCYPSPWEYFFNDSILRSLSMNSHGDIDELQQERRNSSYVFLVITHQYHPPVSANKSIACNNWQWWSTGRLKPRLRWSGQHRFYPQKAMAC